MTAGNVAFRRLGHAGQDNWFRFSEGGFFSEGVDGNATVGNVLTVRNADRSSGVLKTSFQHSCERT
jgi:hypothetical protein